MKIGDFVFDKGDKYGYVKNITKSGDVKYGKEYFDWIEDLIITNPENVIEIYLQRITVMQNEINKLVKLKPKED